MIIVGNGGFAKEVVFLLQRLNQYEISGYVIDAPFYQKNENMLGLTYLGEVDYLIKEIHKQVNVVIAIAQPNIKEKLVAQVKKNKQLLFPNLMDTTALIGMNINVGIGNIVMPYTTFTADITIGDFNMVNIGCTVGHDTVMGSFNSFYPNVNVSGHVTIANASEFGVGTKIIERNKIGSNVVTGAGSVVINDLEDNCKVVGVPATKYI